VRESLIALFKLIDMPTECARNYTVCNKYDSKYCNMLESLNTKDDVDKLIHGIKRGELCVVPF
jgi:hypothetical protein